MNLSFLPKTVTKALDNLNYNLISEIRIRRGQPVMIEYRGEYKYINTAGIAENSQGLITVDDIEQIIASATGNSIYSYVEQMKSGFITVGHGIRIGIAGEYVTQGNEVKAIKNLTSLNIRIPHNISGCSDYLVENLLFDSLHSTLLYSKPGFGKTTMLRDIALKLSLMNKYNVLVFDERGEISAIDGFGNGYDLGGRVDVIRCYNKRSAIASAIRAMKPQVIITDELYGEDDISAVKYANDCGIYIIASSHICNREILREMPFDFYVELTGIGSQPVIYDKNFNTYCRSGADNLGGNFFVREQKEENAGVFRTVRI